MVRPPRVQETTPPKEESRVDAVLSTLEVLLNYIRQGDNPFLHF